MPLAVAVGRAEKVARFRPGVRAKSVAMPRRQFVNGDVHHAGPFAREGIPLTLCGITGMERMQSRVRAPISCRACDQLARWVWMHRRGYGFGEKSRASQ